MFAAYLAGLVGVFFYLILVKDVLIPLASRPPGRADAFSSIDNLITLLIANAILIPALLTSIATNFLTHVQTNWKFYLVGLLVVGAGAAYVTHEREMWQAYDASDTTVWRPAVKAVWLPLLSFLRIGYDLAVPWLNILSGLGTVIRNVIFELARDCVEMNWAKVVISLVDFSRNFLLSIINFIASGFKDDLSLTPGLGSLGDFFSALQPAVDCQCRDLNPAWDLILNETDGLVQSKNLHNFIDTAFMNMWLEYTRVHMAMWVDIFDQAIEPCSNQFPGNVTQQRACKVSRAPDYSRSMDKTCAFFTHGFGFFDDFLFKFINTFTEFFDVAVEVPQLGSVVSPFFCYMWDVFFVLADAFMHIDLFFTLPLDPGNYWLELDVARPYSRLYNVTTNLEDGVGVPLGSYTDQYLFYAMVLVAEPVNMTFQLTHLVIETVRYSLAVDDITLIGDFLKDDDGIIQELLRGLRRDAEDVVDALENIGDEINEALGKTLGTSAQLFTDLSSLLFNLIANFDTLPDYINSGGLNEDAQRVLNHTKAFSIAVSDFERQFSFGFNSGQCTLRALYDANNPLNIDEIPMASGAELDLMCVIANTVEALIRLLVAVMEYIINSIISAVVTMTPGGPGDSVTFVDVQLWLSQYLSGGALDMETTNGLVPITCLLLDQSSGLLPSMMNMGSTAPTCPQKPSRQLGTAFHRVFKRFARLALTPLRLMNQFMRFWAYTASGFASGYSDFCDEIVKGLWISSVVPTMDFFAEIFTATECVLPGPASASLIGTGVRFAFVDTSGNEDATEDCNVLPDGGFIITGLCAFIEFLQQTLDFIVDVITNGFGNAVLRLLENWLDQLVQNVKDAFLCVWGIISSLLVDGFGCIESCFSDITNCECDFSFGGSCSALFDDFKPEIPSGHETHPPASSNVPSPEDEIPFTDIRGACCFSDGGCSGGSSNPFSGQACALGSIGGGVSVMLLGQQCSEQSVCDGATINVSAVELGACCFPGAGCMDTTYAACVGTNNTGGVYVQGEKCAALDNTTCNVELPAVEEVHLGCCVTETGAIFPDVRTFVNDMSAQDCFDLNGATATSRAYYVPGDTQCTAIMNTTLGQFLQNSSDVDIEQTQGLGSFTNITTSCCSPDAYIGTNIYVKYRFLGCDIKRPGEDTNLFASSSQRALCQPASYGATRGGYNYLTSSEASTPSRVTGDTDSPGLHWSCRDISHQIYTGGYCDDFIPGLDASYRDSACTPWADGPLTAFSPEISEPILQALTQTAFLAGPAGICSIIGTHGRWWGVGGGTLGNQAYRVPFFEDCPADSPLHMDWLDLLTAKVSDGFPSGATDTNFTAVFNHPATTKWKTMRMVYFDNPAERPLHAPDNLARDNTDTWCNTYLHVPDPLVGVPSTTGTTGTTGGGTTGVPDELPMRGTVSEENPLRQRTFMPQQEDVTRKLKKSTRRRRFVDREEPEGTYDPGRLEGEGGSGDGGGYGMGGETGDTDSSQTLGIDDSTFFQKPHYWEATEEQRTAHYDDDDYLMPYIPDSRRGVMGVRNTMQVNMTNMTLFSTNASNPRHPCHNEWNLVHALLAEPNKTALMNATLLMMRKVHKECMASSLATAIINIGAFKPDFYANNPVVHPHLFYDLTIGMKQFRDIAVCTPLMFKYVSLRLQRDQSTKNMSWYEYLDTHGSPIAQNSTFCRKMGSFGSMFANDTIARQDDGDKLPTLLAPLNLFTKFAMVFKSLVDPASMTQNETQVQADQNDAPPEAVDPMVTDEHKEPWAHVMISEDETPSSTIRRMNAYTPIEFAFISTNWSNYNLSFIDWEKMNRTRHGLDRIVTYAARATQHHMALHGLASGSGIPQGEIDLVNFCISGECVDCPLLTNTISDVIELILANIEDYDDVGRYLPNATEFPRDNTFYLPDDVLFCKGQRIDFNDEIGVVQLVFDLTSLILEFVDAEEQDAHVYYGQWACFFSHSDEDDPTTSTFWFNFIRRCNIHTGPSCTRGRAGVGLWPSALSVTGALLFVTFVLSVIGVPFPVTYLWFLWPFAWISLAYFMSPMCLLPGFPLPLPQLPLCLADDLYAPVAQYYADNCTDFSGWFPNNFGDECIHGVGRQPVDCEAAPYNFDISGIHTTATILYLIDPKITDYLRTTEFIVLSWLRGIPIISEALDDVQQITDKDEALGCTRRWYPSVVTPILILALGSILLLLSLGLIYALVALVAAAYAYLISLITQLAMKIALIGTPVPGTYRSARRHIIG